MKDEYALGIDIGGTFTDIVVYDQQRAVSFSHKELTTPDAPHVGVVSGIRRLFEAERIAYRDIARVVHATTLFTNALIERRAGAWSRGPACGDATAEARMRPVDSTGSLGPLRGRTYAQGRRHCSALRVPARQEDQKHNITHRSPI